MSTEQIKDTFPDPGDFFQTIFASSPLPMWVYDLDTMKFLTVNKAAVEHYGYTREEFLSMNIKEIRPPEEVPRIVNMISQLGLGVQHSGSWKHRRKDGSLMDVEISSHGVLFRGRKARFVIVQDVTARKRAVEALRKSEEKYRDLFENANDAIFIVSSDLRYLEVNKKAMDVLGYAREQLLTMKITDLIPSEQLPRSEAEFEKLRDRGSYETFVGKVRTSDGRLLDVEVSSSAIVEDGKIIGSRDIMRDITERKRQENALRESEEKYRQVVSSSKDAIMLIDAETGRFVDVNKAAEVQYGYSRDELLNMRRQDLSAEPQAAAVPVLQAAHNNIAEIPLLLHKKRDGTIFPVEVVISSLMYGDKKIHCAVVRDITERRKLEEERLKSHLLESVGILAGGIAHDFNNLLSAIIGNISVAKMRMNPDDKAYQPLTDAELSCTTASELSSRLITFSTGGGPSKKVMSLTGLLVNVVSTSLHGSNISPEFDLPESLYPVSIDERQMSQVVNNLALNAKEAMPSGGKLIISGKNLHVSGKAATLLQAGKYLMISFRDNGVGIPPEDLAKIFDPYFSTKDTFSRKGLGLGLAVCYSVIKRHDGLITVESEYGKGTTFHIYLPAVS